MGWINAWRCGKLAWKYSHERNHRLLAVALVGHHYLDDLAGREQTPEGMACRTGQSGSMAHLDCGVWHLGNDAHESGAVGGLRTKPSEVG